MDQIVNWINANQGLAGWVQAIGSIAAVAGAAWIAVWQGDLARQREERDRAAAREDRLAADRAKLMVASRLVTLFNVRLNQAVEDFANTAPNRRVSVPGLGGLVAGIEQLLRFPMESLTNEAAVVLFAEALQRAYTGHGAVSAAVNEIGRNPAAAEHITPRVLPELQQGARDYQRIAYALRDMAEPGWRHDPSNFPKGETTQG